MGALSLGKFGGRGATREVQRDGRGAGAKLDAKWFEVDDGARQRAVLKLRSELRMLTVLRGELRP